MTPTEALAKALGPLGNLSDSLLAALAADGWTVARTQDARDGEALRLLGESLPDEHDVRVSHSQTSGHWRVKTYPVWMARDTIAAAADACRAAIEATR